MADEPVGAGCRILKDVVLNQVLVSFSDAATIAEVVAAAQAEGTCWRGGGRRPEHRDHPARGARVHGLKPIDAGEYAACAR